MNKNRHEWNFEKLVGVIQQVHEELSAQAGRAVNLSLTLRNWLIGAYIAEYELSGADRASYGDNLLNELSRELRLREDLVHPLLSHAVSTGGIQGAVTWEDGVVRQGVAGGDEGCPRCGDTLVQAGRGVRQCPACEVELFGA